MKKIFVITAFIFVGIGLKAQTPCGSGLFPSIDSLRNFVNVHIRNSAINAFTNLRLNSSLIGITQWLECVRNNGMDSLHVVDAAGSDPDTLKVYRKGVFAFYKLLPAGGSDGNNFTTSFGFNTTTGVLTANRNGTTAITIDLDGRYVQSALKRNDSVFTVTNGVEAFAYKDEGTATDSIEVEYLLQAPTDSTLRVDPLKVESIDLHIANAGNNSNTGTTENYPKQTIDATEAAIGTTATALGKATVGLRAGDVFREQLDAVTGARIRTYGYGLYGTNQFARISGADVQTGFTATTGQANLWQKDITHTIPTTNPGYHYIGVILIDTLLEKTNPLGARIHLPLASSLANANSTDGSYYFDGLNASTETIYINPPDNLDPDVGRYRVDVTVRPFSIDATNGSTISNSSFRRVLLERLWLQDAGHGYGLVAAGDSTHIKTTIFEGGITHNVVFASGTIEKSLFIPGAKGIANSHSSVIMYKPDGTGGYGRLYGNIFINTYQAFLGHTSGSSVPHERVDIFGNYAFADTTYTGPAFAIGDAKRVIVKNNFTDGFGKFFEGAVIEGIFENNKFINCRDWASGPIPSNPVSTFYFTNNLIKTFGNGASTQPAVAFYYPQSNTIAHFRNNIFHLKSDWTGSGETVVALGGSANQTRSNRNVFICDVAAGTFVKIISVDDNALGNFVSDSNVYIIVGSSGVMWTASNQDIGGPNKLTLAEWTAETGMDANSIVIHVTSLNEIYIDPASGNYHYANTAKADSVKMWLAGMTSPPSFFPRKPTYDEAARYIMDDGDGDEWRFGIGTAPGTNTGLTSVSTDMSITGNGVSTPIKLVNDASSPGNSKYYGTNGSGTKGYYDLPTGGTTSPGGSDTHVQFNNAGAFGGVSDFTWDNANKVLALAGLLYSTGTYTATAPGQTLYGLRVDKTFNSTNSPGYAGLSLTITAPGEVVNVFHNPHASGASTIRVLDVNYDMRLGSGYVKTIGSGLDLLTHTGQPLRGYQGHYVTHLYTFDGNGLEVVTGGFKLQASQYINWAGNGSAIRGFRSNSGALEYQSTDGSGWLPFSGIAPLASPAFTGTPTVPTAGLGTNTTQAASTAFVANAVNALGISSGTFTPTLTNVTNVTSSTASIGQYSKVGNVVTFSVQVSINATASGTGELGIEIPVASDFTATSEAAGTGSNGVVGGTVFADSLNDRVSFVFNAIGAGSTIYTIHVTYRVVLP